jgi:hypothetical protein
VSYNAKEVCTPFSLCSRIQKEGKKKKKKTNSGKKEIQDMTSLIQKEQQKKLQGQEPRTLNGSTNQ